MLSTYFNCHIILRARIWSFWQLNVVLSIKRLSLSFKFKLPQFLRGMLLCCEQNLFTTWTVSWDKITLMFVTCHQIAQITFLSRRHTHWLTRPFAFLSLSTFLPPGILPSSLDGKRYMSSSKLCFWCVCVCQVFLCVSFGRITACVTSSSY